MVTQGTSATGRTRILGLPGSVRPGSFNVRLLRAAAEVTRSIDGGAELILYDQPELGEIPRFHPGSEFPEAAERVRRAVAEADAVLLSTPEYNGSIPGGLKDVIDWVSAPPGDGPIRGKPTAVIGADRGEIGCDWAHADARKVLEAAGARVIRDGLSIRDAAHAFDGGGDHLAAADHSEQLSRVLEELVEEGRAP